MEYSKLEYYLSQPRLQRFLRATGNSRTKAQRLYRVNLRVSQAFYPVLNLFEIFLRNTINNHVSSHFSNPNWIVSEKKGFMSDPSLAPSRFYLKKSIQKAEKTIEKKGGTVTSGKVIAEQSLGFWTSLNILKTKARLRQNTLEITRPRSEIGNIVLPKTRSLLKIP